MCLRDFTMRMLIPGVTADEVKKHWAQVVEAMRKEVKSFKDLETIEPALRKDVANVMTSRWVLRWKLVDGKKTAEACCCTQEMKRTAMEQKIVPNFMMEWWSVVTDDDRAESGEDVCHVNIIIMPTATASRGLRSR